MDKLVVSSFGWADLVMRAWIGGIPIIGVQQNIDRWISFNGMPGPKQFEFLKKEVAEAKGKVSNPEKGYVAKRLRGLVKSMKLGYLFEIRNKTVDGHRRRFMNGELRDFLNLKEDGTDGYKLDDMKEEGWAEAFSVGALYHQTAVRGPYLNAKFVHKDGREVVFDSDENMVKSYPDKGTFNYVNAEPITTVISHIPTAPKDGHTLYDVDPYFDIVSRDKVVGKMYAIPKNELLPQCVRLPGIPVEICQGGSFLASGFLKKNRAYWPPNPDAPNQPAHLEKNTSDPNLFHIKKFTGDPDCLDLIHFGQNVEMQPQYHSQPVLVYIKPPNPLRRIR